MNEQNLYKLKELKDYEVADKDPDVRGWDVYTSNNKKIAVVDDLIVDTKALKVRYLNILLNEEIKEVDGKKHLLIPIGAARLDEKDDKVFLDYMETVTLLKTPQYTGDVITRDYERNLRKYFVPKEKEVPDETFYENELFDENKFYGARRKDFVKLSKINSEEILGKKIDIKNQDVISLDGKNIGKVHDAIIDPILKKIRYLDVIINSPETSKIGDKHILIPIGLTSKKSSENKIAVELTEKTLLGFPLYDGGSISRNFERKIVKHANIGISSDEDFYENTYYNSDRFNNY